MPHHLHVDTSALRAARLSTGEPGAAVRAHDGELTYSRFIDGLSRSGVEVDRKVLADLAVREPEAFKALVGRAQDALAKA